jgi:hypothetical protein
LGIRWLMFFYFDGIHEHITCNDGSDKKSFLSIRSLSKILIGR